MVWGRGWQPSVCSSHSHKAVCRGPGGKCGATSTAGNLLATVSYYSAFSVHQLALLFEQLTDCGASSTSSPMQLGCCCRLRLALPVHSFKTYAATACYVVCSLLLAAGGCLPVRGAQSAALLCAAVSEGDLALLRRLLHARADPNVGDYDKRTALHIAAADCNLPVVSATFWFCGGRRKRDGRREGV